MRRAEDWRDALAADPWFESLDATVQAGLLRAAAVRSYGAGERLFSRGDEPDGLYGLVAGRVRVTAVDEDGREALLTIVEAPAWFGEIAVFDRLPRTHDAFSDAASTALHVPTRALDALLAAEPGLWRALGALVTGKLRLAFLAMEDLALLPVAGRVARRLLLLAEGFGARRRVVEIRQEQLAAMVSTSRQTANQVLKDLEARGLVRVSYGRIEIVDPDGLRAAARPGVR